MKKALTAVLIVLLALFMVACDSNPNDEQTPPPEEKTFTPEWVERGEHDGYVVIRVKYTDTIVNSSVSTFTVTDDNIVFEVKDDTGETVYKATADADNASDNNVDTESWTLNVKNIAHPNPSEQVATNATVVVKNDESGRPVMTIEFEAADLNSLIYSFEYEQPVIEPTFAPSWAVGEYSGKIMGMLDANLTITQDSFAIKVSDIIEISSTDEGVTVLNPSITENEWKLSLSGVKDPMDQENPIMDAPVDVVITNTKPNDTLTVKVTINDSTSLYEGINSLLNNIVFTTPSTPTEA